MLNATRVYESGLNVSLVDSRLLASKQNPQGGNNSIVESNLKTINFFVIDEENFEYDFLIGVDCAKKIHLLLNYKLQIYQNKKGNDIVSNSSKYYQPFKFSGTNRKDKYDIGTAKGYEALIDLLLDKFRSKALEDLLEKIINCRYFSTLDINLAFWSR